MKKSDVFVRESEILEKAKEISNNNEEISKEDYIKLCNSYEEPAGGS